MSRSRYAGDPDRPVFIGACPRSGTTLLRGMLDMHPELSVPRETRFVLEAWPERVSFGDLRKETNRHRLARWIIEVRPGFKKLGLDREATFERLLWARPTLGSLLGTPLVMRAEAEGKPRWGDKRPSYAARMHVVWSCFPSALFVNVVRDPRACVASMRRLGWWKGGVVPAIELWERSVTTVNRWRSRLADDQLLEVKFEDLVADPRATLARVVQFAGLASGDDVIAQMLRYSERGEPLDQKYHALLSVPPDPTRTTAWQEDLKPAEIALVESATGSLMSELGYEPVMGGEAPPRKLVERLERRRRGQASQRRRRVWEDRLRHYVTYRRPVAAELPSPRAALGSTGPAAEVRASAGA
jgi:Sulfotransferase family